MKKSTNPQPSGFQYPNVLTRADDERYDTFECAVQGRELSVGSMRELAQLLNQMREAGVIADYALFGAAAQMRYTEPVATLDADVLILPSSSGGLDVLHPIYQFCIGKGYNPDGEAIRVGAWPVQFIPVFDPLTQEALEKADTVEFEGVPFRVVRADHLAVIALSVGRAKDFARILALLEAGSVSREKIAELAEKHGLGEAWRRFQSRFLDE